MQLSAPIYRLKRQAKLLSRKTKVPLHEALDSIAVAEGFSCWSLLAARVATKSPSRVLLENLEPCDLMLLGARPGHGKTMLGLELLLDAAKAGRQGIFFTLEYTQVDILTHIHTLAGEDGLCLAGFEYDTSNEICADYIITRLADAAEGTIAVIDYMQILDQRRETTALDAQLAALKSFAKRRGIIFVFISQIDRSFEQSTDNIPEISDIRLPNPVDVSVFSKTCFLADGVVKINTLS